MTTTLSELFEAKGYTIGVEIEHNYHGGQYREAEHISRMWNNAEIVTDRGHSGIAYVVNGWRVENDASVSGQEIVSPPLTYKEFRKQLSDICALLHTIYDGRAGSDCGLHIHIGTKEHGLHTVNESDYYGFKLDTIKKLYKLCYTRQNILYKAFGVRDDRIGYCNKITDGLNADIQKTKNYRQLRRAYYLNTIGVDINETYRSGFNGNGHYNRSRYQMLNLYCLFGDDRNGTIEFRLFNGTTDFNEIMAYVDMVLALLNMAEEQNRISDAKESREKAEAENEKYSFRTFCCKLGLNGDEFKTSRKIYRRNMAGVSNDRCKTA